MSVCVSMRPHASPRLGGEGVLPGEIFALQSPLEGGKKNLTSTLFQMGKQYLNGDLFKNNSVHNSGAGHAGSVTLRFQIKVCNSGKIFSFHKKTSYTAALASKLLC